ncbi:MAG: lipid A export permease/ATP-binding protein MsbA [Halothiobacillaceae bacterium]|nr:lipid A export permease/ATP-binding protein MsbA [Halothiobacillaceae bacterium]
MDASAAPPAPGAYRRLLGYVFAYRGVFILALLGMVAAGLTDAGFAALMKPMLDGSFVERDPEMIRLIPLALLAIFAVRAVAEFASNFGMTWIGRRVIRDLRRDMFAHLLRLPIAYYDHVSGGELLAKLNYHVEQVAEASTRALTTLVRDSITVVALLGWMLWLSWELALFILVLGPVLAVMIGGISRVFRRYSHRIQDSMGQVSHVAEEAINGQRVVKLYGGQDYEARRFAEVNERNFRNFVRLEAINAANTPIVQLVLACAVAAIIAFATSGDRLESVTVGTFMSFITAIGLMLSPVKRLTNVNAELQKGIAAGESLFALLDTPAETESGQRILPAARGDIRIENLRFRYAENLPPVLDGVDLTIQAGQTVAFVGRSGSGKTTLLSLVPRFFTLEEGRILIDGQDIREVTLASLRAQMAFVSQDITLFNDSVARNIAYGETGEIDLPRVRAAARAAHALEFIEALPQGFQTRVGENGVLLSGGQRQRLALARAFYRDAPILILDEATSALDSESERHIQAALETLMQGRTTLIIAHRLSTVERADCIVVMREGRIVEQGRHEALLARDGAYASLYRLQFADARPSGAGGD